MPKRYNSRGCCGRSISWREVSGPLIAMPTRIGQPINLRLPFRLLLLLGLFIATVPGLRTCYFVKVPVPCSCCRMVSGLCADNSLHRARRRPSYKRVSPSCTTRQKADASFADVSVGIALEGSEPPNSRSSCKPWTIPCSSRN